jgi:hypothetical protein
MSMVSSRMKTEKMTSMPLLYPGLVDHAAVKAVRNARLLHTPR